MIQNGQPFKFHFLFIQQETKPKVWAFLLWKASQLNADNANQIINPWKLYQQWLTLDEAIRETWVVAGRTIQSFARVSRSCCVCARALEQWSNSKNANFLSRWGKEIYTKCQ